MEEITGIHVWLQSKEGQALTGEEYRVKFYDKDPIKDDFLGESSLDSEGHAITSITKSDYRSSDTPLEKYPDIYFKVFKGEKEIYKSKTINNIKLDEAGDFAFTNGRNLDLGKFMVVDDR